MTRSRSGGAPAPGRGSSGDRGGPDVGVPSAIGGSRVTPRGDSADGASKGRRGTLVRVAILVAVAVVLVVMLVGCARYDGDQAAFCAQLRRAPSFMELAARANQGDAAQAAASMRSAAAQYRAMERVAPRTIRHTVSALGDAGERIAANLDPRAATTQVVVVQQDDGTVRRMRVPSSPSQRRLEVFYEEMQNHRGTVSAMYSLTTYARDRCGFSDHLLDLGMAGYGPSALDGPGVSVPAPIQGPGAIVPPTTAPG